MKSLKYHFASFNLWKYLESKESESQPGDTSRIDAINATDRSILETENRLVESDDSDPSDEDEEEEEENESEFEVDDADRIDPNLS